jgi:hypothetical protein
MFNKARFTYIVERKTPQKLTITRYNQAILAQGAYFSRDSVATQLRMWCCGRCHAMQI